MADASGNYPLQTRDAFAFKHGTQVIKAPQNSRSDVSLLFSVCERIDGYRKFINNFISETSDFLNCDPWFSHIELKRGAATLDSDQFKRAFSLDN